MNIVNLFGNLKNLGILGLIAVGILIVLAPVYASSGGMNNDDYNVTDYCQNISGTEYCYHYNYTCNYSAILTGNFSNLPNGTCSFYGYTTVNGMIQSEYKYTWNISENKGVVEGCSSSYFYGSKTEYCYYYNWTCDYSAILTGASTGNLSNLPNGTCSYYSKTTMNGAVQSEYNYTWNVSDGKGVVEGCYNSSLGSACVYYNWTCDYSAIYSPIVTGKFYDLPNGTCNYYAKTTMNGAVQSEYNYSWNISNSEGAIEGCSNFYGGKYCYYYNWICDYSAIYSAMLTGNFSNLPSGCTYYSKTTHNGVVQSEYNYSGNYNSINYSYYCNNNTAKFDFDNNNVINIFDVVVLLENLSDGKTNEINLTDVFYLMVRVVVC